MANPGALRIEAPIWSQVRALATAKAPRSLCNAIIVRELQSRHSMVVRETLDYVPSLPMTPSEVEGILRAAILVHPESGSAEVLRGALRARGVSDTGGLALIEEGDGGELTIAPESGQLSPPEDP